jgi:hypothetical protein
METLDVLVGVPCDEWCIQDESYPLAREEEEQCKESVGTVFRDNELPM